MECAIYNRVSTEKQKPENQLLRLTDFAKSQGWAVAPEHIYIDVVSGGDSGDKRPQFDRMWDAASKHQFDVLLIWALDRFSREGTRETLNYLNQLDGWNVRWRSFEEKYLDTCGDAREIVISVISYIAKFERKRLGERVKAGIERRRREGKRVGRAPSTIAAAAVKERHQQGSSYRQIAAQLNCSIWLVHKLLKGDPRQAKYGLPKQENHDV